MFKIYEQLRETVSWFQIKRKQKLVAELKSIRIVKAGSKVQPILYDMYEIPREWDPNKNYPICDMV